MDFSTRTQAQPAAPAAHPAPAAGAGGSRRANDKNNKWGRIGVIVAIVAVVILLVAAIVFAATGGGNNEDGYVDTSKLQAVFLNTGQVYFGNIKSLNNRYIQLTNIYYLQTSGGSSTSSTSSSNTSVSLVKLGCELHQPYDQMIINQQSVTFWENLQSTGQVAKAVQTFQQQNPNGQKCADQSSSSSTSSSSSAQPANNGSTTGGSTTTTKP